MLHDALDYTIDREKEPGRVCFLVQERVVQVE